MASELRIGLSGWSYPRWRGRFYPRALAPADELAYVGRQFLSVEINNSFYRLLQPRIYQRWALSVPNGFVFAVKGSRYITHMTRLRSRVALANFFASGVLALDDKLGPLLWQLPASLAYEPRDLERFVAMLPRTLHAAVRLGHDHDERLAGRAWLQASEEDRPLRHAIEPRHASFRAPEAVAMLRSHGIALVMADSAGRFPQFDQDTADFAYVRLHGDAELYTSGYEDDSLRCWARRIRSWQELSRDVYVYFDNDAEVRAPTDAARLQQLCRMVEIGDGASRGD